METLYNHVSSLSEQINVIFKNDQQDFIKDELERIQEEQEYLRDQEKKFFKKEFSKIKHELDEHIKTLNINTLEDIIEITEEPAAIVKLGTVHKEDLEEVESV